MPEFEKVSVDFLRGRIFKIERENASALKHGDDDGTYGNMDLLDAKIAAAEARTDTKFAELRGDFASLRSELLAIRESTSGIKTTVITTAIATIIGVMALVIAVFAYGGDMFGSGMDAQTIVDRALATSSERTAERFEELTNLLNKINVPAPPAAVPTSP